MAETNFRPMVPRDVPIALAIIEEHDEDDFEWAQKTYSEGLSGQFVLSVDGQVVGVTGASQLPDTDRAWGISWTYLQRNIRGRGYGRELLESLMLELRRQGARKAFVNTSDYFDPEDGDIYQAAREAYRAVGFAEELRHADFYDKGEAQITYGSRIEQKAPGIVRELNSRQIRLTDVDEIPECEGAFWLSWELDDKGTEPADFRMISDQVAEWGGRVIFMAFPSDLEHAADFMSRCRFRKDGALSDFYEDGVDRIHFRFDNI